MSPPPDTLAGKVLGQLRSEIHEGLAGYTPDRPFEEAVELPVGRAGRFDYVVVGYRAESAELQRRLFQLRAAMVGHTATFALRPIDDDRRRLALSPRQIKGGEETASPLNGPMDVVGLELDTESGRGMAYGELTPRAARTKGITRLQALFSMTNFEQRAQPSSSTTRAVTAYDFAHTMVGHVVDLSRLPATPDMASASQDAVGVV